MRMLSLLACLSAAGLVAPPATSAVAQGPLSVVIAGASQSMAALVVTRDGIARLTRARHSAHTESAWSDHRHRTRRSASPSSAPPVERVAETTGEGSYVRLTDGTVWEVYLPDRTGTVLWRRGDYVSVSRAPAAAGDYDYVLVDARARARALARFVDDTRGAR